ncbi:MAG: autotransporter-associated beta strand repeat-containing protein, partial [Kiritimatiellae bacterium]|nr:autotransporter-associated beta strand repeat-containing protein [Kiritimatiellia bacterium]
VGSRNSGTVNIHNSFTGSVYRTDGGTINLLGADNKIGTVSSSQGTINVYSFGDGTGTLSLGQTSSGSTGTVAWKGAGDVTVPHNITVSRNGTLMNSSAGTTFRVTGTISSNYVPAQFNVRGSGTIVLDDALPASIKLYAMDSAKVVLNGANVATNATTIQNSSATYINNSWTATDRPTATMTVANTAMLAGTGTVNVASVTVNGTLGAGSIETPGTFTVSCPLTLASGSKLKLRIGRSVQDRIDAQAVTVGGSVTVNLEAFGDTIRSGTYRLLDWSSISGGTAGFTLGTGAPEGSLLSTDGSGLVLTVPASGDTYTWQGDGTANAWDTTSLNWLLGAGVSAYVAGAGALFDDTGSASPAVNISSRIAPVAVTVDASAKNYTFSGTGGLTGAMSLVKRGTATLTVETANDYTGSTQINAGKLVLNGSLNGSSVVVKDGANIEQGAGGVIAGEGVTVSVGDGTNVFHGVNTFSGRVEQNATGGRLALICVNNAQSFGAASEVWIRGNLNSNTGILFDDNASISGKTLIIANASGHRPGISSSNNVSGGWLGDIVGEAGSGNGDNLYLTSSMGTADPGGVLTIGVAGGNNVISGKIASVNLRGWRGTTKLYSRLNVTCGIVRNDQGSVYFYSTNNVHGVINLYEGTVSVRATNAICTTAGVSMGKNQNSSFATFELYGCDQTLAGISDSYTANTAYSNVRTISTPAGKPAVLTFNPASGKSYQFGYTGTTSTRTVMTGPLSIVKTGDGTQTFGGTYAITGSIEVRGGTLALAAANVFEKASVHIVSGGTLACSVQNALGGAVDLLIGAANGTAGVVQLDADQTANQLFIGGAMKRAGTYGGPSSTASTRLACFSGTGVLTVRRGGGTMLIFR